MDIYQESLEYHKKLRGKIALQVKAPVETRKDLSLAYTPGVAQPCREIAANPEAVWTYTNRRNWVAVVTDGSAVLGLGNIGASAGLPVMEGKAVLFKVFADVDAFPICLNTQDTEEIIRVVKTIAPSFGGINLEDIAAPRCFEIEERLKTELDIPVFHDDQHGTAIVVLAGLLNALKVTGKSMAEVRIVLSGAGAAGTAIIHMLQASGAKHIVAVDSRGIISRDRSDLNAAKQVLASETNSENINGGLPDALRGADVFIGVSAPNVVTEEMVRSMHPDPIIFAMANPTPEIMPDLAKRGGAAVIATGRSDFPNQINNVLAFPGIFRGALDIAARSITEEMKLAAAYALAAYVKSPSAEHIIPDALDKHVALVVADAVRQCAN
ncbi:MAG: NAD-dependent malic enzyme [Candidatus Kerfeldbacteria bacterium]|nr:NAD-dependent malic enzyme [Candidatus Kerfeldbacteria bacterium]